MKKLLLILIPFILLGSDGKLTELEKEKILRLQSELENISLKAKYAAREKDNELTALIVDICKKAHIELNECDINPDTLVITKKKPVDSKGK